MLQIGVIIIICCLIGIYATWGAARVVFLKRKPKLNAYEAKLISETFSNKIKKVENGIYDDIRTSAFCGNRYVRVLIGGNSDVSFETISSHLKKNGYSVTWEYSADKNKYIIDIQW